MKLSTYMTIAAIIAFIFGVGFILVPAQVMSIYGVTLQADNQFVARYLGAAYIGVAFLAWLSRNAAPSEARNGILSGIFVLTVLGLAVGIYDALAGAGNSLVWLNVVLFLLLAIGAGSYRFGRAS